MPIHNCKQAPACLIPVTNIWTSKENIFKFVGFFFTVTHSNAFQITSISDVSATEQNQMFFYNIN